MDKPLSVVADMAVVMLIDNERELWRVVRRVLPQHQVECCENGLDALERLQQGLRPAVILVDLMMPVMNGFEFRQAQLESPLLATIPIVWLSAVADLPDFAGRLEGLPVLQKPFSLEALKTVLEPYVAAASRSQVG